MTIYEFLHIRAMQLSTAARRQKVNIPSAVNSVEMDCLASGATANLIIREARWQATWKVRKTSVKIVR